MPLHHGRLRSVAVAALLAMPGNAWAMSDADCQQHAATITEGMLRRDVAARLVQDGGIMGIFKNERYFFPNTPVDWRRQERVCMVTLDFRPHDLADAAWHDDKLFHAWVAQNPTARNNPEDVVTRVTAQIDDQHN
jgi:hypothetical protein